MGRRCLHRLLFFALKGKERKVEYFGKFEVAKIYFHMCMRWRSNLRKNFLALKYNVILFYGIYGRSVASLNRGYHGFAQIICALVLAEIPQPMCCLADWILTKLRNWR